MNNDRFKFRVWDKTNEEYVEDKCEECSIRFDGNLNIQVYCDDGYIGYCESYEPHEVIIEQCSGLRDINGNLIYEGDIVRFIGIQGSPEVDPEVVVWEYGCFCPGVDGPFENSTELYEVIGNIHEQKEQK